MWGTRVQHLLTISARLVENNALRLSHEDVNVG